MTKGAFAAHANVNFVLIKPHEVCTTMQMLRKDRSEHISTTWVPQSASFDSARKEAA